MVKTNFFEYLDFVLQFAPAGPEEQAIRAKLARIASAPARPSTSRSLRRAQGRGSPGMKEGETEGGAISCHREKDINGWKIGSLFGDRAFFNGDWLKRAAAAKGGIYGNDAAEAMYPMTKTLAAGEVLDGSKHNYTITFPAGQLPPVNSFWSVTMYDGKSQLLIKNPINSLPHQLADVARHEEECGRIAHALHPEGVGPQGDGSQLVARAQRHHIPGDAPVLAQGPRRPRSCRPARARGSRRR